MENLAYFINIVMNMYREYDQTQGLTPVNEMLHHGPRFPTPNKACVCVSMQGVGIFLFMYFLINLFGLEFKVRNFILTSLHVLLP